MPIPDLQGPYDDFLKRLFHIRTTVIAIEATVASPATLQTSRAINLSKIDGETKNTANAMSVVFLAASYEEFMREEISQCSRYMSERYAKMSDEKRHRVRNAYLGVVVDRFKFNKSILSKGSKPTSLDSKALSKIGLLIESAKGFVVNDDPSLLDPTTFASHANNFKPSVVDELARRLGIENLCGRAADSPKVMAHFGVATPKESKEKLLASLEAFYDRRNDVVHSLNSNIGFGIEDIFRYLELFEATAESIKNILLSELIAW